MGSHQSQKSIKQEWLTPKFITDELGVFDLDPCSPVDRPWDTALRHYTIEDDGLDQPWIGYVWCNPPYDDADKWLEKLSDHGDGIALIFARTETEMFVRQVWEKADAVLFIYSRLFFHHVDGTRAKSNSGAPSVLVSYGEYATNRLKECNIKGKFIQLKKS